MSRIRIINLPRSVDEKQIRDHLSAYINPGGAASRSASLNAITDVTIVRNAAGAVRMAFVGFQHAQLGPKVVAEADGTYLGAMPIKITMALDLKGARDEKAKQEQDNAAHLLARRQQQQQQRGGGNDENENNLPRRRNRDDDNNNNENAEKDSSSTVNARLVENSKTAPSWGSELLLPPEQRKPVQLEAANDDDDDDDDDDNNNIQQKQNSENQNVVLVDSSSDVAFLNSITTAATATDSSPSTSSSTRNNNQKNENFGQNHFDDNNNNNFSAPTTMPMTSRVKITRLPYVASSRDLKKFIISQCNNVNNNNNNTDDNEQEQHQQQNNSLFSSSDISECHIPLTRDTQQSKGLAFVRFASPQAAQIAVRNVDGAVFLGCVIRACFAQEDPFALKKQQQIELEKQQQQDQQHAGGGASSSSSTSNSNSHESDFKAIKDAKRKKADNLGLSWNTTYIASSTAVGIAAKKLGVDADDIVGGAHQGAAVRAAVAEAHITAEARKVLGSEGIDFDMLSGDRALHRNRSDTTILIKHIAPGVTLQELSALFARSGVLECVAAPPTMTVALVRFADAEHATSAFQRWAYKKVKGQPLFLEWAPIGALTDGDDDILADEEDFSFYNKNNQNQINNSTHDDDNEAAATAALTKTHTVYVTNLPFGLSENAFREFLSDSVAKLASRPELLLKLNLQADKGRAYISVADAATETLLITKLEGKNLKGRVLGAQRSKSNVVAVAASASSGGGGGAVASSGMMDETNESNFTNNMENNNDATSTSSSSSHCPPGRDPLKLIVKNIPFEATENDLRQLFAAFSEVKSVRVPRRLNKFNQHHTNNHRGFGFVEFLTAEEALRAKAALSATHLYGRHLVLDFAQMDQGAAAMGNLQ